jgi:hypothetical protein
VPYTVLTPEQMTPARLRKLDVLLVPNVDVRPTYKRLGHDGRTALQDWVRAGGRYVGWQGGALEASALHLSTVGFTDPTAASPGALMRVDAPHPNTYVLWDSYDDQQMSAGSAQVIAAFPTQMFVSRWTGWAPGASRCSRSNPTSAVSPTVPRSCCSTRCWRRRLRR